MFNPNTPNTMSHLTLTEIRPLVSVLEKFFSESKPGESRVFLEADKAVELNGCCEDIFMTNLDGMAVVVRFATCGDWTKALLIPSENFPNGEDYGDQYSPADEALEWFFE